MADDAHFMARAIRLAEKGLYTTDPNPRVGCILVKNDRVVGEGFHLIHENGISAISSIMNKPMDIQTAIDNSSELLLQASDQLLKAIKIGIKLENKKGS